MAYRTNKLSLEGVLLLIFFFVILSSALKPWVDLVLPGVNQLITLLQFALLTVAVTFLNRLFYKTLDFFSLSLLLILFFQFAAESVVDIYEADLSGLVSQTYVIVRALLLIYLFQVFIDDKRSVSFYRYLELWLLGYFVLTFFYCLMQSPEFFDVEWMRTAGGNVVSFNFLGFFRSNGGMGGTVIDYANFLLPMGWLIFYSDFRLKLARTVLLLIFFFCVFLNFSRVLFLCLFLMGLIHFFSVDNVRKLYSAVLVGCISICYTAFYIGDIINAYIEFASTGDGFIPSDEKRLASWAALFVDFTLLDLLGGRDLGGNTGFFLSGAKISGDGFVTGFIYDAGIVATLLLLAVNYRRVLSIPCLFRIKLSLIVSLTTMLIINSGYEKLFVLTIFCVVIGILHNNFERSRRGSSTREASPQSNSNVEALQ